MGDFPGHKNFDRDVLVVCDEPQKDNSVNQLWDYFETIWEQEDCRYFHNSKKLADRQSVKKAVLELQEGYQQYFEVNKEKFVIQIMRMKPLKQKRLHCYQTQSTPKLRNRWYGISWEN